MSRGQKDAAGREPVVFYAKGTNVQLVREPHVQGFSATGQQFTVQRALRYSFAPDGFLRVIPGEDVRQDGPVDPESLEQTRIDAVTWLRNHPSLNELFWEEGAEPGKPQPPDREFIKLVQRALVANDRDAIVALKVQEDETHKRPNLLLACDDALDALSGPVALDEPSETPSKPSRGRRKAAEVDTSAYAGMERAELEARLSAGGVDIPAGAEDDDLRKALAALEG